MGFVVEGDPDPLVGGQVYSHRSYRHRAKLVYRHRPAFQLTGTVLPEKACRQG